MGVCERAWSMCRTYTISAEEMSHRSLHIVENFTYMNSSTLIYQMEVSKTGKTSFGRNYW